MIDATITAGRGVLPWPRHGRSNLPDTGIGAAFSRGRLGAPARRGVRLLTPTRAVLYAAKTVIITHFDSVGSSAFA